ncbi:MAG: ABC transporter substrate-binding protein [Planctomycetaceae bacterium]
MIRTRFLDTCLAVAVFQAAALSLVAQEEAKPGTGGATEKTEPSAGGEAATTEEELPLLEDMELPTFDEFLDPMRRDWVVLKDGRVLVVEPIYPRPNTLAQIQAERDTLIADTSRRYSEEGKQRLAELTTLGIFLPGEEGSQEFRIKTEDVQEVRHHEDLMLLRADQLVEEGDTRRAFELLFIVSRIDPAWPGLDERQLRLLVADASRWIDEGQGERALALIGALYERNPVPPQTVALLGQAAAALIGGAIDEDRYREARFALNRVRQLDGDHPAVPSWTNQLIERARTLQAEAERASTAGDGALAATLIDKAAWAWPTLAGLKPAHARLTSRYQRLLVGVPRLAGDKPLVLPTVADERVARLTTGDLFEVEGFDVVPAYRSVYFDRWEPTDLGRRARFELRPSLPGWAARPALSASDAIRLLSDRMHADHPKFDARFVDLVDSLQPSGPFAFEVVFNRIPLRAEAALTASRSTARIPTADDEASASSSLFQRFVETDRTLDRVVYQRAHAPATDAPPHLAEVVEIGFANYELAARAFDRGEIRMLADVPIWDVPRLQDDKRFVVTKLALPATHVLQFHPGSEPFKTAELRRVVAVSTDAAKLLPLVAGAGTAENARLVTAPYPSTHVGYNPLVEPRPTDLSLALALTLAAERRFEGNIPEIVFIAPAEAPARQAAETLAVTWKRIGLPVRLQTFDELAPGEKWDIAYRKLAIADPVASLASFITLDPAVHVSSLADLPDWLRQRLLDLERAGDAATAQAILIDLHRQLHSDVRCVPLFEVDRFVATRGAIRGMPGRPVAVYQSAERWVLPTEYPEATP